MDQVGFILCVSGTVAAVAYFVVAHFAASGDGEKLRSRLAPGAGLSSALPGVAAGPTGIVALIHRIGQAASEPFMPTTREKQSGMRRDLARAGVYAPSAIRLVAGGKVIFLCLGLAAGYFVGLAIQRVILGVSLGGLLGYVLPNVWLRLKIDANQRALTHALPDGLDLMVVCVEAGLTIDAAMQRVGAELSLAHPALSRELGITHMETRVGLTRADALKNLGLRTGNPSLQSLGAMLAQADRFGTSVAQSLRVHAESLRATRQHAAEEQAAKASVKMSFPLVLFIFPATFIILAGPTIADMLSSDFFK